jgi:hypothetical protein
MATEKIRSIIEKRFIRARPAVKATFPPVLRQGRVLSAIISEPEYLVIAFLTAEEEKRFRECLSRQIDPLAGLITTGPEKAACRAEKVRYATLRSCTVANSFGISLGPDSTIILEDHHQIIDTADAGTVSYTVPLAYIISYGNDIERETAHECFNGLVDYSMNMWREGMWLIARSEGTECLAVLSQLQRTRN